MSGNLFLHAVPVRFMDMLKPFFWLVADFIILTTEHGLPARGEIDHVRRQIPVPKPVVGPPSSQRIAFFALFQFFLGAFVRELRANSSQGDSEIDRLGQIVVGSYAQSLNDVFALVPRRHHDDGHFNCGIHLANLSKGFEAADFGHLDIEQDQIDRIQLDSFH